MISMSSDNQNIISELGSKFGDNAILYQQMTKDGTPTIWIDRNNLIQCIKISEKRNCSPF